MRKPSDLDLRVLDWLLDQENPSVRYLALRDLAGVSPDGVELRRARKAVMDRGPVPRILAKQDPGGFWGRAEDFYVRSKYKGTVWTFILLAELAADGSDPRIGRACDFVLRWSQDRSSGGFAYRGSAENGGQPSAVVPCLTGNMLWGLIRFGKLDDPRVQRGVDWIVKYLRCDDGRTRPPQNPPYNRYEMCWGKHTCIDAVVKPLKALAEIPQDRRSPSVRRTIALAREFLLLHRLYQRSHESGRPIKLKLLKLGFPLMWDTDVLEMLGLLARLGCRDPRLEDARGLVLSKRDGQGRWVLEESFSGRTIVGLERRGYPSRWVTLKALTALRALGRPSSASGC